VDTVYIPKWLMYSTTTADLADVQDYNPHRIRGGGLIYIPKWLIYPSTSSDLVDLLPKSKNGG